MAEFKSFRKFLEQEQYNEIFNLVGDMVDWLAKNMGFNANLGAMRLGRNYADPVQAPSNYGAANHPMAILIGLGSRLLNTVIATPWGLVTGDPKKGLRVLWQGRQGWDKRYEELWKKLRGMNPQEAKQFIMSDPTAYELMKDSHNWDNLVDSLMNNPNQQKYGFGRNDGTFQWEKGLA